eukprot:8444855-Karenia_brevis.AAC.1
MRCQGIAVPMQARVGARGVIHGDSDCVSPPDDDDVPRDGGGGDDGGDDGDDNPPWRIRL